MDLHTKCEKIILRQNKLVHFYHKTKFHFETKRFLKKKPNEI